jgi:hypothetical protein
MDDVTYAGARVTTPSLIHLLQRVLQSLRNYG